MEVVRLGIIGLGNMGSTHVGWSPKINRLKLVAVCDLDESKLAKYPDYEHFTSASELIQSGKVDAVLVATPHYAHTTIGIEALEAGLHVLVEKPISVHKADALRLIAAWNGRQVFAAMFNQRTDPHYQQMRKIVQSGELGEVQRVNWIITDWFRTETYYASGGWRATWRGEGGGVLLNQCPHNLDLLQWIAGMPTKMRAFCNFGKHHRIEVEDEVTAYFEYANGATGVFITTTGEAPGTNRLEIAGDRGKVVLENGTITFYRTPVSVKHVKDTSLESFATVETWTCDVPVRGNGGQHTEILQNFVNSILDGATLLSPAVEGLNSVELANAMLLSAWTDATVSLPIDPAFYEAELKKKVDGSAFAKETRAAVVDMAASF